jgi:hypothetical protein
MTTPIIPATNYTLDAANGICYMLRYAMCEAHRR